MIDSVVIYEVHKILEYELNLAIKKGNEKRSQVLQNLRDRFPSLIRDLDVRILSTDVQTSDLNTLESNMRKFAIDIGDAIICEDMKRNNLEMILSGDEDWKRVEGITIVTKKTLQ